MCLIAFAWQAHPEFDLIVAANRDEFHGRPSQAAHWWQDAPDVLAGRDLLANGTWFAVGRDGRFATVTNYREQSFTRGSYMSRGGLVADFVIGQSRPSKFSEAIDGDDYAGFNLLTANADALGYVSNRGDSPTELSPGVYGLSNASLDTPWSKLTRSKCKLRELIDEDAVNEKNLLLLLADRHVADEDVNSEHLPFEQARAITAPFIVTEEYGTRCSTVYLRRTNGENILIEKRFDTTGDCTGVSRFTF